MDSDEKKIVEIPRKALYQQVWTKSLRLVARDYGVSDVGLAKICKKHAIPRPAVGYWSKRAVGKAPPQPPLPSIDDPQLQLIVIDRAAVERQRRPRVKIPPPPSTVTIPIPAPHAQLPRGNERRSNRSHSDEHGTTNQAAKTESPYISPKELAARWRCSRSAVDRIARRVGFKAIFLGHGRNGMVRYRRVDVETHELRCTIQLTPR